MRTSQPHTSSEAFAQHVETLSLRYTEALELCSAERAVVSAGTPRMRDRDDQPYPFRADPYFLQWLPLPEAAGSLLEIRPGHKPHLILARDDDFWHAPPELPPPYVLPHIDLTVSRPAEAPLHLHSGSAATLVVGPQQFDTSKLALRDSGAFVDALDFTRGIKTAYEIDCISHANVAAAAGHRAVAAALAQGVSEFHLHMTYCEAAGQSDAELPYPSIIGLNEHAAVLHYQRRDRNAPPRTASLLIDAGAQVNAYAADVTRTWALDNEPFAALIAAMNRLQQQVCTKVRAGTDFVTLNEYCHELLGQLLVEFEFVECSAAGACESGATAAFLPHGLGHLLGLQVHDVGGHSIDRQANRREPPPRHPFLRLTRVLEADMVVTIEPGIYFIDRLLAEFDEANPGILRKQTVARFAHCGGIRIEDNVRVKSGGHENLTRSALAE